MDKVLRRHENHNRPLVGPEPNVLGLVYFNLVRLGRHEEFVQAVPGFETVFVVMSGNCSIEVDGELFSDVGQRQDIWSGNADSVYAPSGARVRVVSNTDGTEIAVGGGKCETRFKAFRVPPAEVEMVDVGSPETHSHRRIFHILGHNAAGRAGNLLVSELYGDGGCWAGYPPHKHDTENPPEETQFEELYHYRFRPENGFGALLRFYEDGTSECYVTRCGDTFLIDKGLHPLVTSPGHEEYIFTILVGKHHRSLIQNFQEEYRHLISSIPGINAMRDSWK
ncbi:MAG: 5-deoxy-glucuronate isomerase [Acidobacteriia bacterium]|nr:5-deoxy-glucuronate isomerase [Terriglobia bacterium]